MIVADLIAKLQKMDQNAVVMKYSDDTQTVSNVEPYISFIKVDTDQSYGRTFIQKFDYTDYNAILFE